MAFNEWYSGPDVIDFARKVMGSIDTDPATSYIAQEHIKAQTWYTKEDDGLTLPWYGNVWCNPPYSRGDVDGFVDKAIEECYNGNAAQILMLVNSATDTAWYHKLLENSSYVLIFRGRIKFWKMFGGKAHEKWQGKLDQERGIDRKGNSPRYTNSLFMIGGNNLSWYRLKTRGGRLGFLINLKGCDYDRV